MNPLSCFPKLHSLLGLALMGLLVLHGGRPAGSADVPKLNVLFIAVDDLRPALGCYGWKGVKTPNIDRLAERGVRFDRAYCQFPLCNPSRSSLMTGRYPTTTGVQDNLKYFREALPEAITLPQYFRANGYTTLRTGKLYHGGIDDAPSWVEGAEPQQERKPRNPAQREQYRMQSDRWVAVEGEGQNQPDYRTASRAIELLEKQGDKPFFLAAGFVKPHSPLIAPKKYFDLYDPADVTLPEDFAPRVKLPEGVPAGVLGNNGDLFIDRDATEKEAREMIVAYQACTSFVDAQVGRVLDALNRLPSRRNTVVVFFGDHGYHLGEKGKWSKHNSLYDAGTRVPLVIATPGLVRGAPASSRTVELVDLYPTLVELCGLPPAAGLEGQSLVPLLKNGRAEWAHPAITYARSRPGQGQSVRTERHRLTVWEGGKNGTELYDLEKDPHERRNLAADPEYASVLEQMMKRLR